MNAIPIERLELHETGEIGRPTATYIVSTSTSTSLSRVDTIRAVDKSPVTQRLLGIFLPNGYPHTVSSDYTPYQIYDSLQAFFSAIAGLLASRAVVSHSSSRRTSAFWTSFTLIYIPHHVSGPHSGSALIWTGNIRATMWILLEITTGQVSPEVHLAKREATGVLPGATNPE